MLKKLLKYFGLFLILSAILFSLIQYIKSSNNRECNGCNVIIIDIDHLRSDAVSCDDEGVKLTPNLCKFISSSYNYNRNFSHNYWTLPSVASTFTSLYPSAHKVRYAYKDKISPQTPTLFDLFKRAGYSTAFIGPKEGKVLYLPEGDFEKRIDKREYWDFDLLPEFVDNFEKEKDPYFIFFYTGNLHIPYLLQEGKTDINNDFTVPLNFPDTEKKLDELVANYLIRNYKDIFTEKAINENRDLFGGNLNGKRDQILEYYNSLDFPNSDVRAPWDLRYAAFMEYVEGNVVGNSELTAYMRFLYDQNVALVDKQFGVVAEKLLSKDTIVVLMSDHGDEFGEHDYFAHYKSIYNEIIKTPLAIYVPGGDKQSFTNVTENIDIYPTILDLVGIDKPDNIQGESLVDLMKGNNLKTGRAVAELSETEASIQDENWKLIAYKLDKAVPVIELYNLQNDPNETVNLVNDNKIVADEMLTELKDILRNSRNINSSPESDFPGDLDDDTRKRLIERGYF